MFQVACEDQFPSSFLLQLFIRLSSLSVKYFSSKQIFFCKIIVTKKTTKTKIYLITDILSLYILYAHLVCKEILETLCFFY